MRLIKTLGPARFPRLAELAIDWRVILFAALCAVTVAAATALWPAVIVTRASTEAMLRKTPRGGVGRGRAARQLVLAAQVALSMVLLVASGLLIRSLERRVAVDPGFSADGVLTFEITLPPASYPEVSTWTGPGDPSAGGLGDRRRARGLRANPRIAWAGIGKPLPLERRAGSDRLRARRRRRSRRPIPSPMTEYIVASDGLFEALGARLASPGGLLTPADRETSQPVTWSSRAHLAGWSGTPTRSSAAA